MNKFVKYFIALFSITLLFASCQDDDEKINVNTTDTLTNTSPLSSLLLRVSQNPTSNDNVVDNSSCFSIQLPVTVIVNSQQIIVSEEADYQIVQDAIEAFSNDDDIVNFVYPITIKFQNFQTQVLQNANDLDDVLDNCGEDDDFDEIDCVSINYPIVINVYDSNNQLANTITLTSNSGLFNFFDILDDNIYVAIVYPITVTNSAGQNVSINSNTELESFFDDSIDDCEDTSGNPNPPFTNVLNNGSWHVSYFFDDEDETTDYNGYDFTFFANNTIEVIKNSISSNGSWSTYVDSGLNKIELDFDNSNLEELEKDWIIIEYTETIIRLKHSSGGNGGTYYLTFTKN
jgi:hypothetical protein